MKLEVITTLQDVTEDKVREKTAVVFDVLRCTTSIVTALANGCRKIIPAASKHEAIELYNNSAEVDKLLAGEVNGVKLPEFHLGNSPLEFTARQVKNKTIIMSTTNGTLAIKKCKTAHAVLIGSFLNISSVCRQALAAGRDIAVICAGTKGRIALEDILVAGMVVAIIRKLQPDIHTEDPGLTLYHLYQYLKGNMKQAVYTSRSGLKLHDLGLRRDIDYSLQKNRYAITPVFRENAIRLVN